VALAQSIAWTLLGTRRAVKVAGTLDGHPFEATPMPSGKGPHWLPLRAALCKAIGKTRAGEVVAYTWGSVPVEAAAQPGEVRLSPASSRRRSPSISII